MSYLLLAVAALAACGRLGFEPRIGIDATSDTPPPVPIAYVRPFAQRHPGAGTTDAFAVGAASMNDLVVLQVSCADSVTQPTAVTVDTPGWTWLALDPITGDTATMLWSASFVARAPDTVTATLTVTWAGTTCSVGKAELGDELANVLALDRNSTISGSGDPAADVTTSDPDEAIWAAVFSATTLLADGSGYTKGADDLGGDWAEYRITTDPAQTVEHVTFSNSNVGYVMTVITLAPH